VRELKGITIVLSSLLRCLALWWEDRSDMGWTDTLAGTIDVPALTERQLFQLLAGQGLIWSDPAYRGLRTSSVAMELHLEVLLSRWEGEATTLDPEDTLAHIRGQGFEGYYRAFLAWVPWNKGDFITIPRQQQMLSLDGRDQFYPYSELGTDGHTPRLFLQRYGRLVTSKLTIVSFRPVK
jgi:hypothetical protein